MEEKVNVLLFNLPRRPLAIDQGGEERGSLYNLLVSWAAGDRWLLGFVPKVWNERGTWANKESYQCEAEIDISVSRLLPIL